MSVHVSSWAWQQPIEDPTTKLVLLKLADQANDEWECWPSRQTIASDCGISPRSVTRHTKALTDMGLLAILERQRDNESRTSNLYKLIPPGHGRPGPLVTGDITPETPASRPEPSVEPSSEPLLAPARADAVWDALVLLFGEPSNDNERGKRNKAVKLIKQSLNGGYVGDELRAAEIARRAGRWSQVFSDAAFTDMALANQWGSLVPANVPGSSSNHDPIRAMQQRERDEREAQEALALPPEESKEKLRELMERIGAREIT